MQELSRFGRRTYAPRYLRGGMPADVLDSQFHVVQAFRTSLHCHLLVHDEWRAADCWWSAGLLLHFDQKPPKPIEELASYFLDLWILFLSMGHLCVVLASWYAYNHILPMHL